MVQMTRQSQSFWYLGQVVSALYSPRSLSVCIVVASLTQGWALRNVSSFPCLEGGGRADDQLSRSSFLILPSKASKGFTRGNDTA